MHRLQKYFVAQPRVCKLLTLAFPPGAESRRQPIPSVRVLQSHQTPGAAHVHGCESGQRTRVCERSGRCPVWSAQSSGGLKLSSDRGGSDSCLLSR